METDAKPDLKIDAELERRVLHGLLAEWHAVRADLPGTCQAQLRPPLFRIADLKRTWGQWNTARREIVISRQLVHHHPWDAVREVLHHEMAHQLASRMPGGDREPPHGPCFQQACHLLKANPRASGRYPTLDQRLAETPTADARDRLMDRIRKLLALAASPHPGEAQAAMAKARELTDKYNLQLIELDKPAGYVSVFLGRPALRHTREAYQLAHLILTHYWVEGLWIPAYVLEKGKMGRVLEISGTPVNVQSAAYAYDFIRHYIQAQWRAYRKSHRLTRHQRVDFAMGIITGFQGKLEEGPATQNSAALSRLPAVRSDPHLQAYMARRYPRTQNVYRRARQTDLRVLADGMEKGRRLVIAKGIETRHRGPRRALPAPE